MVVWGVLRVGKLGKVEEIEDRRVRVVELVVNERTTEVN
jgi:hypothetical protein